MKKIIAIFSAAICAVSMGSIYAEAVTDIPAFEVVEDSVHFTHGKYELYSEYIIASTGDFDSEYTDDAYIFTPQDEGWYVVTNVIYVERIVDVNDDGGHLHCFYPCLANYNVTVQDGEISVELDGLVNFWDEEKVNAYVAENADTIFCTDFCIMELDEILSDPYSQYYVYANSHTKGDYCFVTYDNVMKNGVSQFVFSARAEGEMTLRGKAAEMEKRSDLAGWIDGNFEIATCDTVDYYILTASRNGHVEASYSDINGSALFNLFVKDGAFVKSIDNTVKSGDTNGDGEFTMKDAIALQKWIIGSEGAELYFIEAADLCKDGRINVFDMCMMEDMLSKRNMPKFIDRTGTVTVQQQENLYEAFKSKYPGIDYSDFTFEFDPNHPLNSYLDGDVFYVYFKGIRLHGYGNLNTDSNVYAVAYEWGAEVELLIDPELLYKIDTERRDLADMDPPNPIDDTLELVIYIDDEGKPQLAFRWVPAAGYYEVIYDAVTGDKIEYIPYNVV